MITLYDFELDENCYKVRLLLAACGLAYEKVAVNVYPGREHQQPAIRALNPLGTLPILTDAHVVLHGAEAILWYLAKAYAAAGRFIPDGPPEFGEMATWLQFAATQLQSATSARQASLFAAPDEASTRHALQCFRIMEDHMTARGFDDQAWFAGQDPSLAEFALFPHIALSRDFGVEHEAYPALRRWMRRIRKWDGFITMPGVPDYA